MKLTTKTSAIVALSLTGSSRAFAPVATSVKAGISMKRPLTQVWNAPNNNENDTLAASKKSKDPTPALFDFLQDSSQRNAAVASAALVAALATAPLPSDAAMSGGRIGGSSFSSSPPVSRSMGPSRSYSYSSRTYYSPRPYYAPPMISPIVPITPFYSPFGYGGAGVMTFGAGPGLFSFLLLGGMALAVSNVIGGVARNAGGMTADLFRERTSDSVLGSGTSVLKLSVALDVSDRDDPNSILSVLNRLANTAQTDSRVGIQNLSSQVALELLRRKSSIAAASSEYKHFNRRDKAQQQFNSVSVKERGKFERETTSKYGGVDYSSGSSSSSSAGFSDKATMAVVTLVLAIDGDSTKLPRIRSIGDVEEALRKISADVKVSDCLQGAEILWTPEDRSETLTYRDVVADYPELSSL